MPRRPFRAALGALATATALGACTSWQRVADPASTSPEESLVQLFNPGGLYRSLDRLVSTEGVPYIGIVTHLAGPGDSTRTLIGLSLTNRSFAFERRGDAFEARYRVEYTMTRPGSAPITVGRDASVRVGSLQESLRTDESILLQQELKVIPGDYTLTVRVADRTTGQAGVVSDSITVPAFVPGTFTEPILAYEVRGRGAPGDSVALVLNPRGSIAYASDTLLIYLEGVGYTAPTTVPLQVRDARDSVILQTSMRFTGTTPVESQIIRLAPDSVPLGELQVVVGPDGAYKSRSAVISFSGNWLITNFDDLLSLLRYFGEDNRINQMREASPERRVELWREFFFTTDPNRMTPENEALDNYFGRLAAANALFRDEGIPGWRTDRGEVYVSLGVPDEVFDASPVQQGRFIRWAYYDLRAALIFHDPTGFGRYRLTPESRSEFERVRGRVIRAAPN